jgi:hypothetical protein
MKDNNNNERTKGMTFRLEEEVKSNFLAALDYFGDDKNEWLHAQISMYILDALNVADNERWNR